ncbi:MAG: hypothetical protein SWY16_01000, partial [Cyanobacteriota bacterium]|nr:hypothetical protein [Cyanobacteriota bacterium]
MSRTNWQWSPLRMLPAFFWAIAIAIGISGCSDGVGTSDGSRSSEPLAAASEPQIVEVSPPRAIAELRRDLEIYRPQVSILSPKPDTVFEGETVTVQLQVRDLPIFKNDRFGLGPHLNVILDNQPEITVYDPNEPLVLEDVSPGTHTLRVFASRPWHESFKNEGAYAQTTFHVYTRTDDNHPDSALPLLTYSRPAGRYGAEPILFDYYLTNAPLHLVAQESGQDDIVDWQVRWTIDGKSFSSDRWQPIYLKGFAPGKHWVQLEFLDELGNPVKNAFNNTVRTIVYEPGGEDSLSQLVRGKIAVADMRGIVDPLYTEEESTPEEELRPSEMSEEEDVEADTESEVLEEVEPEISEEEATGAETVPGPLEPSELEVSEEETTQTETVPEVPEQPEPTIFEEETTQTETVPEVLDESELEVSEEETTQTETVPEVLEQPEPIIFEEETTPTETVPEVLEQPESEISKEETTEAEPESEVPDESELEVSEEETTEAEPESEVLEESELEVSEEETTPTETVPEVLEQPELEVSEEETTEAEPVPEVLEESELEV